MALNRLLRHFVVRRISILAAETSCDDTALCILKGPNTLHEKVLRQYDTHAATQGILPRVAASLHAKRLPLLLNEMLRDTDLSIEELDIICATRGPGMVECLEVGHQFLRDLALQHGKPFWSINHLEAHILAISITQPLPVYPFLALILSGGHTELILCSKWGDYTTLCSTIDDSIGEAIDKVARMLGYPYDPTLGPTAIMLKDLLECEHAIMESNHEMQSLGTAGPKEFSFSGLKESVRRSCRNATLVPSIRRTLAIRFLHYCARELIERLDYAHQALGLESKKVVIGGGVACNQFILNCIRRADWNVITPSRVYCTDNAAMIANVAYIYHSRGMTCTKFRNVVHKWSLDDLKFRMGNN